MGGKYFGTDGIRGRANRPPITPDVAMKVGMAAGLVFTHGDHRHRVVIGKDTRLSSYMIENALTAGFLAVGVDVLLTGPVPTPGIAMLTRSMRCDLGVMISASHNPYDDNGIKLFGPDGAKLTDAHEAEIEALIDADLGGRLAAPADLGRAKRIESVTDRYIEYAKRTLPRALTLDGIRVVVDCANGAGYRGRAGGAVGTRRRGLPDGGRPRRLQHQPRRGLDGAAALAAKVREVRADIGIALDGDADRVVVVDERGQSDRRRPDDGGDRHILGRTGAARQARRRRHRDVQSRARALPRRDRPRHGADPGGRPPRRRGDARARATISAASSRATSSSPTIPPPATAWSPRSSSSRWCGSSAGRSARSVTSSSRSRRC